MRKAPATVGGLPVVLSTTIDERQRHTGNCRNIVAGVLMGAARGLAICHDEAHDCFYLFGCDEQWEVETDSWHQTLAEARAQAEFEYEGVGATWEEPGR